MRRRLAFLTLLLVLAAALAPVALAGDNGGIAPPDSATESGSNINELYWIVMGILIAIFLVVEGALVWSILRYRRRPRDGADAEGPQIHGHTKLELLWTAIPTAILIAIFAVTMVKVPSVEATPEAGDDPVVVEVTGHQFYWEYVYENGVAAVDTLRLPVGQPVQLVLNATDVIHSWWVPELTGKRDTIPGRTNTLDFTITRAGSYEGQCGELCGSQHALMHTTVEAVSPEEFDAWLASQSTEQADGAATLGRQTWEGACAKCHGLDGGGGYGPAIAGNSLLADAEGLGQLLAEGRNDEGVPGYMPPVSTGWPEGQLQALIDYIASEPELAPAGAAEGG